GLRTRPRRGSRGRGGLACSGEEPHGAGSAAAQHGSLPGGQPAPGRGERRGAQPARGARGARCWPTPAGSGGGEPCVVPQRHRRGAETDQASPEICLIVFFLYIPVVGVVFAISRSEQVAMGLAFAWMALYAFAGIRVGVSKCPRCGRRFHYKRFSNPWSSKC